MNHYPIYLFDSMRHVQGQVMAMGGVWLDGAGRRCSQQPTTYPPYAC
jgi:type IV secretory pathway VirB4 component